MHVRLYLHVTLKHGAIANLLKLHFGFFFNLAIYFNI